MTFFKWNIRRAAIALVGVLLVLSTGCASRQHKVPCSPSDLSGCVVEELEVIGNNAVSDDEIAGKIATAETDHVLGGAVEPIPILGAWDALTVEYEHFDRFVLERDLQRVERLYRSRGYYDARARAGRAIPLDDGRVRVEIVVEEGEPVRISKVELDFVDFGLDKPADLTAAVTNAKNGLVVGAIFDESTYDSVKTEMRDEMRDKGFAYGEASGEVVVDPVTRTVLVKLKVTAGPACKFGKITIVGLGKLPEKQIRGAIGFKEGDGFSTGKISAAESALADFNVFASTEFLLQPNQEKKDPVIPVLLRVTNAPLRLIKTGIGAELGDRVEIHGIIGWEDRNLTRLLDRFSVDAKPALVFYPTKIDTLFDEPPFEVLPHLAFRTQYRLPFPFEPRTILTIANDFSLARPRNADTPEEPSPDQNILGYREYAGRIAVERRFYDVLFIQPSWHILYEDPFSYNLDEPPVAFQSVVLPYFETFIEVDFRKNVHGQRDALNPYEGAYVSVDAQLAVGGDAFDVRLRPEVRGYLPLSKKVVLAARFGTGFLFAFNYGDLILDQAAPVGPLLANDASEADEVARAPLNRDRQLLELRALYSGGPNSNRGYRYNNISPHAVLDGDGLVVEGGDAIGGRTLWETGVEVRFPVVDDLGGTVFVDASDVTKKLGQFRLTHPHISVGIGIRYATPVGPLRFDIGVRVPYLQQIGVETVLSCTEKEGGCTELVEDQGSAGDLFGAPIALSVSIGEAY